MHVVMFGLQIVNIVVGLVYHAIRLILLKKGH